MKDDESQEGFHRPNVNIQKISPLTHLTARAAHSHSVHFCDLESSIGTSSGVLSEAEVVVRAHVDNVLHHFACMPDGKRQKIGLKKKKVVSLTLFAHFAMQIFFSVYISASNVIVHIGTINYYVINRIWQVCCIF